MEVLFSLNLISLIAAISANTFLALLVYRDNPRSATNVIYGLLSLNIVAWLVANYLSVNPNYLSSSLFLIRLSLFFAMPISMLFYFLANALPRERLPLRTITIVLVLCLTAVIMLLNLSPFAITRVVFQDEVPYPIPGPGILPFAIFSTLFSILAIYVLVKKIREGAKNESAQLRFVMMGVLIMLGLIVFTVFIPNIFFGSHTFLPFLPFYTFIFLGMTAFAIVRRQLFNIKVVGAEALTVTIWIALLSQIATADTSPALMGNIAIFVLAVIFGIFLIRSVHIEVEAREKLESTTAALQSTNERLEELSKIKSEFLSFASHQVKTPLSIIKGYAELIIDGSYGKVSEKVKETSEKIVDTSDRMIALLNNLLDLKKIEEGKMELVLERTDINSFVKSVVDDLRPLADAKNLTLTFVSEVPEAFINADPQKLRQVFQNFVDNAIKYTEKGWVEVRVNTSVQDTKITAYREKVKSSETISETKLIVSVSDSGRGISEELLPNLFKQFSRDPKVKSMIQGTGLGLYIAKQIVEAHGGKAWVESKGEGQGSAFFVSLPAA